MSLGLCERIWIVFINHLHHLLLMMSECLLAIRHKKGEYICRGAFVVRGRFLMFWSYGALDCIQVLHCVSTFLAYDVFLFLFGLSMIGGDTTMYLYMFLVSPCLLIYIYEVIHDICLYFVVCEIKKLFFVTCIFHICVYAFVECFRNIQVDSVMLLSTLATDR